MKQKPGLHFGFDLSLEKGATFKPKKLEYWKDTPKAQAGHEPFKYFADALTGLTGYLMNHYMKSPVKNPQWNFQGAKEAWSLLDPHVELYQRSLPRIQSLRAEQAVVSPKITAEFETLFDEAFEAAVKSYGYDLTAMGQLLDTLSWLENKSDQPFLYNIKLNFSKPFQEKLMLCFSFLYHLRSLVALDHNAHIEDPSHEGVKIDAITDYLPKAEYVVNDAILYWNFKKLSVPFASGVKGADPKFEKLFMDPMKKSFQKYSHHAVHLLEQLPVSFTQSLNPVELEEALYLVQMDWLLGSPAGLLFKIREELYGMTQGYEKIFWKDVEPIAHQRPVNLTVSCEISEEHYKTEAA